MSEVAPIKPSDVVKQKQVSFPGAVLEVFNQLITQKFNNGYATIKQDEVVALLVERGFNEKEIFGNNWLDIEDVYREAGWKVEYDKPAYNESYPATFKFSLKQAKS